MILLIYTSLDLLAALNMKLNNCHENPNKQTTCTDVDSRVGRLENQNRTPCQALLLLIKTSNEGVRLSQYKTPFPNNYISPALEALRLKV